MSAGKQAIKPYLRKDIAMKVTKVKKTLSLIAIHTIAFVIAFLICFIYKYNASIGEKILYIVPPENSYNPITENKKTTYQWVCNDSSWIWDLELPASLYNYSETRMHLRRTPHGLRFNFWGYVEDETDDQYIKLLANEFTTIAENNNMSETEKIYLAVTFVQSIDSKKDIDSRNVNEYPRFPIQTLWDRQGDCEDKSTLLCSLLISMGYDSILIRSDNHMAVGLAGTFEGNCFIHDDKKYYFIETTVQNKKIGELPDSFLNKSLCIVE